jgi:hypothetical protein
MIYLQVKHFALWREIKKPVPGCESIEVTNPKTKEVITKHGYKFDSVEGHVVKLVKYDTGKTYATRYFGFKMHLADKGETFVLDMPYQSQILRRFLRTAPNIDWTAPLCINAFKSKKDNPGDPDSTGIWFRQRGETIKPYHTKETPNGMPQATHDKMTDEWDFKPQQRWLVEQLQAVTIPAIEKAAASATPPVEHDDEDVTDDELVDIPPHGSMDDSEPPF